MESTNASDRERIIQDILDEALAMEPGEAVRWRDEIMRLVNTMPWTDEIDTTDARSLRDAATNYLAAHAASNFIAGCCRRVLHGPDRATADEDMDFCSQEGDADGGTP